MKLGFRNANENEAEKVLCLYKNALGGEFCVWSEDYPSMREIRHDMETGNLYVLTENEDVVGAISIVPDDMDELGGWTSVDGTHKEFSRVVIDRSCQGRGLASIMVLNIIEVLRNRGYKWVHLAVAKCNLPAYHTYLKNGFKEVGEEDIYGNRYILMERLV